MDDMDKLYNDSAYLIVEHFSVVILYYTTVNKEDWIELNWIKLMICLEHDGNAT